jgi:CheY-like chemotaxis protein/signal transduction histidine kinase
MHFNKLKLCNYIDHSISVEQGDSADNALRLLKSMGLRSIAIVNQGNLIGLASKESLSKRLLEEGPSQAKAVDCLLTDTLKLSFNSPILKCIDQALSRPPQTAQDDIAVVDESNKFFGITSPITLFRLQNSFLRALEDTQTTPTARLGAGSLPPSAPNEKAEQKDEFEQLRTTFISRFTYEAITPMNSIKGVLDLLGDSNVKPEHKQMIQSAFVCTKTLLRLVQNTLEYTKIQNGQINLSENSFSPRYAIENALSSLKPEAQEKGITLQLKDQDLPDHIFSDEARFTLILKNIIGRSIENSIIGGILIKASTDSESSNLKIDITHPGLALGQTAESIYGLTPIVPEETSDIATMVSQSILTKMGGSLTYDQTTETGEHFIIKLPLRTHESYKTEGQATQPIFKALPSLPPSNEKKNRKNLTPVTPKNKPKPNENKIEVLVVDDNPVNIQVAKCFLRNLNCTVHTAMSGKEGIEALKRHPSIECVFMDCLMPKLSGFETTQMIRQGAAGEEKSDIFISAMTASTNEENKVLCYEAGMNHFMPKPVSLKSFSKALNARLHSVTNIAPHQPYETSFLNR